MPIVVRYGDTGDLGAMASFIGQQDNFAQRFAMGQSLVQNAQDQYARQDAMQADAFRLQLAAKLQEQQMRTMQQNRSVSSLGGSPMAGAVRGLGGSTREHEIKLPDGIVLSPQDQAMLKFAVETGNEPMARELLARSQQPMQQGMGVVRPAGGVPGPIAGVDATGQIQTSGVTQPGSFVGPGRPQLADPPNVTQKRQYLAGLEAPPDLKQALTVLAEDPNTDLRTFDTQARAAIKERETASRQTEKQRALQEAQARQEQYQQAETARKIKTEAYRSALKEALVTEADLALGRQGYLLKLQKEASGKRLLGGIRGLIPLADVEQQYADRLREFDALDKMKQEASAASSALLVPGQDDELFKLLTNVGR